MHQYLQGRLVFHNHPPTLSRPRHRNHYVNSQIFVDSAGREHMLLNFYVQGRPPGSASYAGEEEDGFFTRMSHKAQLAAMKLGEMSFEDIKEEATTRGIRLVELTKGMFRFLTGEEDVRPAVPPVPVQEKKMEEKKGWMSSVTGMFSGIKGSTRSGSSSAEAYNGPTSTEGEVHADLVMVCPCQCQCLTLKLANVLRRMTKGTTSSAISSSTCQIPTPGTPVECSFNERTAFRKRNL